MHDWQARAQIDGEPEILAVGNAIDIKQRAAEQMEKRNIGECRLWQLVDDRWVDVDELLLNVKHDPHSPVRE